MAKPTKPADAAPSTALAAFDWSSTPTGFEQTHQSDMGIPYLAILHAQSPQVNKADKNYPTKGIEGAQAGDIINNLTNSVIYRQGKEPLIYIPVFHERLYVEWTPRNAGGGLVKVHRNAAILQETTRDEENGRDVLRSGNIIVTTSYFYGIAIIDGEKVNCIIGMASKQMAKARKWLNQMAALKVEVADKGKIPAPMFSHSYKLSTTPESNAEGSWFGWVIDMNGPITDVELIKAAIESNKDVAASQRLALPAPAEEANAKKPPFA